MLILPVSSSFCSSLCLSPLSYLRLILVSIYSTLSPTSMPPNIRYLITMVEVLLNTAIGNDEKVRILLILSHHFLFLFYSILILFDYELGAYLTAADTIVPQTNPQVLLDAIIRMCMKTFAHMKCFEATLLRYHQHLLLLLPLLSCLYFLLFFLLLLFF